MDILLSIFLIVLTVFVAAGAITIFFIMFLTYKEIRKTHACKWTDESGIHLNYVTGCKNEFYNSKDDGSPITDWAKYCPYCKGNINLKTN